ncbi:MAG: glycosyltransferase family 39 protein [Thermoprotei archaeon]
MSKISLLIIALALTILFAYIYYDQASRLYISEIERSGKGYVSDEVWYVSSARNILEKIFGFRPKMPGSYGASIIVNKSIDKQSLEKLISKYGLNIKVVDTTYNKIKAIYVEFNNVNEVQAFVKYLEKETGIHVIDVIYGWRIPDAENINNYLNTEHPPLAKYLVALSIALLGDYPIAWRIPSIIAGALTVLISFLIVLKITGSETLAFIVALFVGIDPMMRSLSSIALLDVFVALFTVLALYFIVLRKYYTALIVAIIGSLFKFSALFILIPVTLYIVRTELRNNPTFHGALSGLIRVFSVSILLFIGVQVISSVPLIQHLGFGIWFQQAILGAFKWHMSSKCVGASCPISSSPWDWFMGVNGFPLYYFSADEYIVATGFWPFWLIALIYSYLVFPIYTRDRDLGKILVFFHGVFLGYVLLWILGNKTQYSFYAVQFTPLVYLILVLVFVKVIIKKEMLIYVINMWISVGRFIWKTLLKILLIT